MKLITKPTDEELSAWLSAWVCTTQANNEDVDMTGSFLDPISWVAGWPDLPSITWCEDWPDLREGEE